MRLPNMRDAFHFNHYWETALKNSLIKSSMVAIAFAASFSVQNASADLVGQWNFNETSGTTAYDSSGSGINGTLEDGAVFVPGAFLNGGGAVQTSWRSGFVNMGNNYDFWGLQSFSIQAWVLQAPGDTTVFYAVSRQVGEPSVTIGGYALSTNYPTPSYYGDAAAYQGGQGPGALWTSPSTAIVNDGHWHQMVSVYSPTFVSLYVDGALQNSISRNFINELPAADFIVGGGDTASYVPTNFSQGMVSKVAVWNSALTGADVTNLYQSTINPVPEPETYAMMLAGLGLIGFVVRRRKQQAA